jgi:hypothetical protein
METKYFRNVKALTRSEKNDEIKRKFSCKRSFTPLIKLSKVNISLLTLMQTKLKSLSPNFKAVAKE